MTKSEERKERPSALAAQRSLQALQQSLACAGMLTPGFRSQPTNDPAGWPEHRSQGRLPQTQQMRDKVPTLSAWCRCLLHHVQPALWLLLGEFGLGVLC